MKRNGGFGIGLLACLVGGVAGGCVGGAPLVLVLVEPPAPPDEPVIVAEAPVLRTLPVTDFLVPPDLTGLDDEILTSPMLRNPEFRVEIDEWIEFWRTKSSRWFPRYLERMAWFEETVDSALAAHDLPPSLRYLPLIESGYSPDAVSVASAAGLWQFMEPTARGYGMQITRLVDERRDPYKSTTAAVRFLATLRQDFGSWFLALAAYNAGPGRVERVLERYAPLAPRSDSLYWVLRRYLPKETQDFVPKLLGAIVVAGSPASYGYQVVETGGFDFEQVMIPDATTLDVVARASESTESEIARLNPEYVRGMTPPGRQVLVRVPPGKGLTFHLNYARIPLGERVSFVEHEVSAGETLGYIAREYGIPLADLRAANPLIRPRRMRIGALITVPVSPSVRRGSAPAS